jgi:N-acetylmuramic acid 6-phosphate etherase
MDAELDALFLDALFLDGTEAVRADLADLDLLPTADAVRLFIDDALAAVAAVRGAERAIGEAIDTVAARMQSGGRLIYVGAGAGGREAAADAAEIGPSYGLHDRVVALGVRDGLDEDDAELGAVDLGAVMPTAKDTILGLSASGRTPYVLGAVAAGRSAGAHTIGLACVTGSPLSRGCDLRIEIPTGPEIIAGSTRLKAGSAQKLVLNTISSLVMVRLGRTYGNLMIDAATDNAKLRHRAVRVVVTATGVDEVRAAAALEEAGGRAKIAVVTLRAGVSVTRAEELLDASADNAKVAISLADARD